MTKKDFELIKDLLAALRETFAALEDSESLSSDEFFRLRAQFRNVIAQAEEHRP